MDYMTILNSIQQLINDNIQVSLLIIFVLLSLIVIVKSNGKKKKLKKTNYKKVEKGFYNTGFKTSTSFYDILKIKLRVFDFDDKLGVRYIYLIQIKFFKFEICKMKYTSRAYLLCHSIICGIFINCAKIILRLDSYVY